jgi:K+ transporter
VTFISFVASFFIGLPLFIICVIYLLIANRISNARFINGAWTGITVALVICSTLLSIPIGNRLLDHDIHKAKTFCESLIPLIEQSKTQDAVYPQYITAVLGNRNPPRLLGPSFYWSDGTNFTFVISDPSTLMGGFEWSSQVRDWHEFD